MRRIPALDGLRGVAILLVVVFHAWPWLLPGGGYGVTVFFVLSGFLITGLLLREDKVDLKRFYWNRAVRLLPALVVLLVVYFVVWEHWRPVLVALSYTANYAQIYGEPIGRLSHTWSLAVEEHFYLVWPLVVAWMRPTLRLRLTTILFAATLGWRMLLMVDGASFARVNYATDTVAFALLAGCLLALLHHEKRLPVPPMPVTLAAVGGIVATALVVHEETSGFLWGAFLVVGLSTVAIAGSLRPVPILENRVLVWFGVISYGLYLWHVPVLWSRFPASTPTLLVASLVFTWASYRFVEQPLRTRFHKSAQVGFVDPEIRVATRSTHPVQAEY